MNYKHTITKHSITYKQGYKSLSSLYKPSCTCGWHAGAYGVKLIAEGWAKDHISNVTSRHSPLQTNDIHKTIK